MAFQFLCPQGHLLEGDETQAGQPRTCPHCGTPFLIPEPIPTQPPDEGPAPPPDAMGPGHAGPPPWNPPSEIPPGANEPELPAIHTTPGPRDPVAPSAAAQIATGSDSRPPLVHIPCPSGHELETPRQWLGKLAMCPFCRTRFYLRWENSVEYREQKAETLRRKQAKAARMWLHWSVAAAVVVVLGLILLIILSRVL